MQATARFLFILCFLYVPVYAEDSLPITLEYAVTSQELHQGLMERTTLPPDHGMIFIYQEPAYISIWMYNTKIDLSLAFLDENKVIREIHELKAYPNIKDPKFFASNSVTSSFPAKYGLEMNAHWFTEHDVKVGDKAAWSTDSPAAVIIKQE